MIHCCGAICVRVRAEDKRNRVLVPAAEGARPNPDDPGRGCEQPLLSVSLVLAVVGGAPLDSRPLPRLVLILAVFPS